MQIREDISQDSRQLLAELLKLKPEDRMPLKNVLAIKPILNSKYKFNQLLNLDIYTQMLMNYVMATFQENKREKPKEIQHLIAVYQRIFKKDECELIEAIHDFQSNDSKKGQFFILQLVFQNCYNEFQAVNEKTSLGNDEKTTLI